MHSSARAHPLLFRLCCPRPAPSPRTAASVLAPRTLRVHGSRGGAAGPQRTVPCCRGSDSGRRCRRWSCERGAAHTCRHRIARSAENKWHEVAGYADGFDCGVRGSGTRRSRRFLVLQTARRCKHKRADKGAACLSTYLHHLPPLCPSRRFSTSFTARTAPLSHPRAGTSGQGTGYADLAPG